MKISEIPFVGYPVTDVNRARNFYEQVLGLKLTMHHEMQDGTGHFWIEYDIGQGCLAISNIWPPAGNQGGPTMALEVDDLDKAMEELKEHGMAIDSGFIESPGCRFFLCQDPDGNPICMHQMKSD